MFLCLALSLKSSSHEVRGETMATTVEMPSGIENMLRGHEAGCFFLSWKPWPVLQWLSCHDPVWFSLVLAWETHRAIS